METKIKTAGLPVVTAKSLLPLNTIPVGLPTVAGSVAGIVTLNPCFAPEPSYSVETPVALSEAHQGVTCTPGDSPRILQIRIERICSFCLCS